jgi:hypothetical protein
MSLNIKKWNKLLTAIVQGETATIDLEENMGKLNDLC